MAQIRNYISLTDYMTPTLRKIMKAMDSTMKVMSQLDRQLNKGNQSKAYKTAAKDIQIANNALIKMMNHNQLAASSAEKLTSSYKGVGSSIDSLSAKFSLFTSGIYYALRLTRELADAVGNVMTSVDQSRSNVARLGLYNQTDYSNEQLYGAIFKTAMDTRTGLDETASLVNNILMSEVFKGQNAVLSSIGTAGIINKALVAGGGTAEQNSRALTQLVQGLSSGVLQGDELRSIREQTPYFAQVLAEGLGKIDQRFEGIGIGDLKELGSEGELTSDRVIRAMWAMQDEIDEDFSSMPKTFGQAMTALSSLWEYFLWQLSLADGPFARLNELIWQFVDYLQSEKGSELFESIAIAIEIVVTAVSTLLQGIGAVVTFLQDNAPIAQALFIGLGTAIAAAGVMAMVAWIAAVWPLLLVIAAVGLISYAFLSAGATVGQVVGGIIGTIIFLAYLIYDILIVAISTIGIVFVSVGMVAILIVQAIVQAILWLVTTIVAVAITIYNIAYTIAMGMWGAFKQAIVDIYQLFVWLGQGVLSILESIAAAIDFIFGSNLQSTISGWIGSLGDSVSALDEMLDPKGTFQDIGDQWVNSYGMIADMYTGSGNFDDWNITDNMADIVNGGTGLIDGILNWGGDSIVNPVDGWDLGMNMGQGFVDSIGEMGLGNPTDFEIEDLLKGFGTEGVPVSGGNLDSVGSIKSDVDISDEDLQLLRDMASREFLLNLQTVTPSANITFGDIHETADVKKILDVIEQMVEEQLATSMVS